MKKYDICLLDADDTLFDFSACCKNALSRAMTACGFCYQEDYHARYLAINGELWRRLERREITHEDLFRLRFAEFLTSVGFSREKSDELNQRYVAMLSEECIPFDGVEAFLKELGKRGRVYVITNGTACVQRGRFEKFGLKNYVSDIFISEEMGVYKPAIAYFSYVAARIPNFDIRKTLIVGDGLTSDIALANAAGVDSVWYNPAGNVPQGGAKPTYAAASYGEILKIIGS